MRLTSGRRSCGNLYIASADTSQHPALRTPLLREKRCPIPNSVVCETLHSYSETTTYEHISAGINRLVNVFFSSLWLGWANIICLLISIIFLGSGASAQNGRFNGDLRIAQIGNGPSWQLLAPIEYIDPKGRVWKVPRGATVNGASIPRQLWGSVAYPWDGPFAKPSVVHDYFWSVKSRHSQEVHRVFYDALRTTGVPTPTAKVAYLGVLVFGHRWTGTREAYIACAGDRRAENNTITLEEISEMCAGGGPRQRRHAKIVWRPNLDDASWEALQRAAQSGLAVERLERMADRLLIQNNPETENLAKEFGLVTR